MITAALTNSDKGNVRTARRLAGQLLNDAPGADDQRIVNAFTSYLKFLNAGDERAVAASRTLVRWHQSPRPEPYFLELLQAQAHQVERKAGGVFYTPWPIAEWIVQRIEALVPAGPLRLVDPACGGGVFLLAAADLALRRPGSVMIGYDTSAAAIAVADELLRSAGVCARLQQINPLLAGEELQGELLSGNGTLVVLGNPPYANFGRRNCGPWIDGLISDYRACISEQKLNLTDDCIKFLRWGQHWIDQAGRGVLAMITSRTYLAGITHRGMRHSLAQSFPHIEIVDLHGDGEQGDENVFGIRRGVAIGVFAKASGQPQMQYLSLCGSRSKKLAKLQQSTQTETRLVIEAPDWLFTPVPPRAKQSASEYSALPRLNEIFTEFISGVQTKNDLLFVDFDRDVLTVRIMQHLAERGEPFDDTCLRPYVVGPFDRRWIYYDPRLLGRARWSVMRHMVQVEGNVALIFMRQSSASSTYDHALVVDTLASDRVFYSRRGAPFLAPLWRSLDSADRVANLSERWTDALASRLGFRPGEPAALAYLYAILHAPSYRREHLTQLQRDFPRIPWPRSSKSFCQLAELGTRLIDCHLADHNCSAPKLTSTADDVIVARGYPRFQDDTLRLNPGVSLQLDPVAKTFQVGGYSVIERWLKVRRGRALSADDLQHVGALCEIAVTTRNVAFEIETVMQQQ